MSSITTAPTRYLKKFFTIRRNSPRTVTFNWNHNQERCWSKSITPWMILCHESYLARNCLPSIGKTLMKFRKGLECVLSRAADSLTTLNGFSRRSKSNQVTWFQISDTSFCYRRMLRGSTVQSCSLHAFDSKRLNESCNTWVSWTFSNVHRLLWISGLTLIRTRHTRIIMTPKWIKNSYLICVN